MMVLFSRIHHFAILMRQQFCCWTSNVKTKTTTQENTNNLFLLPVSSSFQPASPPPLGPAKNTQHSFFPYAPTTWKHTLFLPIFLSFLNSFSSSLIFSRLSLLLEERSFFSALSGNSSICCCICFLSSCLELCRQPTNPLGSTVKRNGFLVVLARSRPVYALRLFWDSLCRQYFFLI